MNIWRGQWEEERLIFLPISIPNPYLHPERKLELEGKVNFPSPPDDERGDLFGIQTRPQQSS
jgi:hypothetical protein